MSLFYSILLKSIEFKRHFVFQDIVKLTQLILDNSFKNTAIKLDLKTLYDVYKAMQRVIYAMHILEVHYLHLPLNSVCLQGFFTWNSV